MTEISTTEDSVNILNYLLDFPGIGGEIKRFNNDFVVREILPNGEVIFDGSEIGKDIGGMYIHFVLWKSGLDTYSAIRKIKHLCNYQETDFNFAGLKDAQAESLQRISVWQGDKKCLGQIQLPNLKIINPIKQKFAIPIGDLSGNQFQVRIRDPEKTVPKTIWDSFVKEAEEKGFLNYFGMQRFGSKRPTLHLIGKYILQEDYASVLEKYIGTTSKLESEHITKIRLMFKDKVEPSKIYGIFPPNYLFERLMLKGLSKGKSPQDIVFSLPKYILRLSISAYQSYIFNKILSTLDHSQLNPDVIPSIPLIGYKTELSSFNEDIGNKSADFLSKDGLSVKSFKHKNKIINSKGTDRLAIVKPKNVIVKSIETGLKDIEITFDLPKGSYGTMFVREVIKSC
ncbi:MAG: tRNA pseudouridine(13) synthase TruD [Candidatus Hodarchaeales archaeon]|jgi:tRNA pseudouridine13 synthase